MRGHGILISIGTSALIGLVSAGCGSQPGVTASTGVPATSAAAASASPAGASALAEGVYRTDALTLAAVEAALTSNGVSTTQFALDYQGVKSITFTIRFGGGQMTWFESRDGGPDDIDATGTYVIENGDTIVETDANDQSVIRIDFTDIGSTLKTHWTVDPSAGAGDPHALAAITAFFDTAPYTRQP
jgi:hypothetical protein